MPGCDICQQVCPWNIRFASPDLPVDIDPGLQPAVIRNRVAEGNDLGGTSWPQPELSSELLLTPQVFNRKFKDTPLKRTKRRGYLRNIAVVLGNQASPAAIAALTSALQDLEPLVRSHAAWALGQLGTHAARQVLETAARSEIDPVVRAEILNALDMQNSES